MMMPNISSRIEKVRRLMDSPNAGEAAAAAALHARLVAKHGTSPRPSAQWREELSARIKAHEEHMRRNRVITDAVNRINEAGYGVMSRMNGLLYVVPLDDVGTILFDHVWNNELPLVADLLEEDLG